jgi:hypothetical protein
MRDYTGQIKGIERERKRDKARHGMRLSGRSLKSTVQPVVVKRARKAGGDPGQVHYLVRAEGETDAQHCACGAVVYAYHLVTIYASQVTCNGCKGAL